MHQKTTYPHRYERTRPTMARHNIKKPFMTCPPAALDSLGTQKTVLRDSQGAPPRVLLFLRSASVQHGTRRRRLVIKIGARSTNTNEVTMWLFQWPCVQCKWLCDSWSVGTPMSSLFLRDKKKPVKGGRAHESCTSNSYKALVGGRCDCLARHASFTK